MYLKKILIRILKIKNGIFLAFSLFLIMASVADILSLCVSYPGDWYTISHAKSTPQSIDAFLFGTILLLISVLSRNAINQASFYSSYFEGDLDGIISFDELGAVVGKSPVAVSAGLRFLRPLYMKNFTLRTADNQSYIELYSKTVLCSCKSCGAIIDKKEYFTGICPFCRNSDLFASVLTDNKVYHIANDTTPVRTNASYYTSRSRIVKMIGHAISAALTTTLTFVLSVYAIDCVSKSNDQEYMKELILSGKSYSSFELIQKDLLNQAVYGLFFALVFLPLAIAAWRKMILLVRAGRFADWFAKASTPFIPISKLSDNHLKLEKTIKYLRNCIQSRYLRNCSLESHNRVLRVSLAKKIVRDKCPHCGAPVTGAVDANYICQFCGNKIMNVIQKK